MTCIHGNKENKLAEWDLLHDILNPTKRTKKNSQYSPIIQGYMNTRRVKDKFKEFITLLDSGCISTIVIGKLIQKLHPK